MRIDKFIGKKQWQFDWQMWWGIQTYLKHWVHFKSFSALLLTEFLLLIFYAKPSTYMYITVYHSVLVDGIYNSKGLFVPENWPKFETSNISRGHSLNTKWEKYSPGRHDWSRLSHLISISIAASQWSTGDYSFDLSSILYNTKDQLPWRMSFHSFESQMHLHRVSGKLRRDSPSQSRILQHRMSRRRYHPCTYKKVHTSFIENEKKLSDSCNISVIYGHYLVNFYIARVDASRTLGSLPQ